MDLEAFRNPPAIYRPAPFWSWNDSLDKEELKRQIREMAAKGWGGYFMHSRVGLVTGYLSDEWMELVRSCAEEARQTGTYAWLYDEDKWPSGFAGGEVPQMSEDYRSRALVLLKKEQITENDSILKEYEKDGEKYFICKRISALDSVWFNGTSYVDLMNQDAVKVFIKCTHERYKENCKEYFGREIPGIFTDEPCYLMENHYSVPVLPWSDYLPSFFARQKGYAIDEHLEYLFFDIGDYYKVRFDFYDCTTRLFIESFTKQYYNWCRQNNLKMTGHFMAEDNLPYQTQWIGAAMPHYQFMHWPGIDKLGRHIEQLVTVKQLTSVVDQLDKERAFCEVFGCIGQQASFYHRKWIADWEAVLGISFVNHHLSLYSMRGERKRDFPANLFYQQPWWEDEKPFSDYIGRLNLAVSQGKRVVDILVIHPIASVWCEYSPLHKTDGFAVEKSVYDTPFEKLSKGLIANKLDFHYGDEIIMEEHARVENGKLVIGSHTYSTVIVPPCRTLRKNTVSLLERFAESAGRERLIFVKTYPERIDGEISEIAVLNRATKLESVERAISVLDGYYKDRISITDKMTGQNASKVICHVRRVPEGELMLIANTDEMKETRASVRIPGAKSLALLDLMSGELYEAPCTYTESGAILDVTFYPAGSLLLINAQKPMSGMQAPRVLDSGIEFECMAEIKEFIKDWEVALQEENVLPLNKVTLYLNGEKVLEDEPVAKAWHDHFYRAADGTPFRAEYTFHALDIPGENVFAVVEAAENLDRITFNGHEVKPMKKREEPRIFNPQTNWKDVSFIKVHLDGLILKGKNTLVLEGKKVNNITGPGCHSRVSDFLRHAPTEVETVYIVGNFQVIDVDREVFMIGEGSKVINSKDLTSSGYPFYAGSAKYKACVKYSAGGKPVFFRLNNVEAASIKLYVNGEFVSLKYWKPYIFDITKYIKDGWNTIEIVAATTLFNTMGPNQIAGIKDVTFVSPRTFIDFERFTRKYELLPFGIGSGILMEAVSCSDEH